MTEIDRAEVQRRQRYVLNSPAVRKPGWLPRGLWPELDELAKRHDDALEASLAAGKEAQELGKKFKDEDEARIEAYKTGLKVPKMTDPAERERLVAEAKAKVEAAKREFADSVYDAVKGVQAHAEEWQADVKRQRADAEAKIEEAKRLVAESQEGLGQVKATEHWIERTATDDPGYHLAHSEIPVATPYDPREDLEKVVGEMASA
jgi:hypothetical protein